MIPDQNQPRNQCFGKHFSGSAELKKSFERSWMNLFIKEHALKYFPAMLPTPWRPFVGNHHSVLGGGAGGSAWKRRRCSSTGLVLLIKEIAGVLGNTGNAIPCRSF